MIAIPCSICGRLFGVVSHVGAIIVTVQDVAPDKISLEAASDKFTSSRLVVFLGLSLASY